MGEGQKVVTRWMSLEGRVRSYDKKEDMDQKWGKKKKEEITMTPTVLS